MHDVLLTPSDVSKLLATRVRAARRRRGWTQAELARRSAVSIATVARLEQAGLGQVHSLLAVCAALGHLKDFDSLLREPAPKTLEELRRSRS